MHFQVAPFLWRPVHTRLEEAPFRILSIGLAHPVLLVSCIPHVLSSCWTEAGGHLVCSKPETFKISVCFKSLSDRLLTDGLPEISTQTKQWSIFNIAEDSLFCFSLLKFWVIFCYWSSSALGTMLKVPVVCFHTTALHYNSVGTHFVTHRAKSCSDLQEGGIHVSFPEQVDPVWWPHALNVLKKFLLIVYSNHWKCL